jgi:hypothetical protein
MLNKTIAFAAITLITLSGCGGGGGGGGAAGGSVSGVVAIGAAVSAAALEVKCAKGSGSGVSRSDGTFDVTVTGAEYPCMVKASGGTVVGAGANNESLFSVASSAGRVNVTPLTHMIAAKALGKQPSDAFAGFGVSADAGAVSAQSLTGSQAVVVNEIKKLGINANLGATNLMNVVFVASESDAIDYYTTLVYQGLGLNGKTLTAATQELISGVSGFQVTGAPKSVCKPGLKSGFTGALGTDQKLAFVPIDLNLSSPSDGVGGDGGVGGGDGPGGDGSLGQFFSTTVTVERADGSVLGSTKTGAASGAFTMVTCGYTGPLKITMTGTAGSTYFDEGLGQSVSFEGETMRAVIDSATKNVGITPFTEAAYRYLVTKLNTTGATGTAAWANAAKINEANGLILRVVNRYLPKELFLSDITRMPAVVGPTTTSGSIPDTANGIYGLAVAALAIQTKGYNPSIAKPGLASLKQLADDLADGSLDRNVGSTGQAVSDAPGAAYSVDSLGASVAASAGQLAKQTGVASLAGRVFTVTRVVWKAVGTSYFNSLPSLPNIGRYSYVDLMSDGSVRVIHPLTNAVLADSFDVSKSPFLSPSVGAQARIVKLTGGDPLILALDVSGTLYAAGEAGPRQGNGIAGDQPLFHTVPSTWGGARVSSISHNGGDEAFARTSDGRIWGWGFNNFGQMGALNADTSVPVSIFPAEPIFVSVNMSGASMFAIKFDGTVWSWGRNFITSNSTYGRLGRGTGALQFTNQLAQVTGLANIVSVVPSAKAIFALSGSGEVFGWGQNFCNVLGDSVAQTVTHIGNPAKLGISNVTAISTSGATGYALRADGVLLYWGSLPANALDPAETQTDRSPAVCKRFPVQVPLPVGDPRNPGLDSSTRFVKLEKVGFGAVATTASGQIVVVYGSNAFGANTNN